jgi:hypothetical protein
MRCKAVEESSPARCQLPAERAEQDASALTASQPDRANQSGRVVAPSRFGPVRTPKRSSLTAAGSWAGLRDRRLPQGVRAALVERLLVPAALGASGGDTRAGRTGLRVGCGRVMMIS